MVLGLVLALALWFAVGVLMQVTDWQVDERFKIFKNAEYLTGFLYGFGAGFLALQGTEFATLVFALALAMLFAGKIDRRAHQMAIAGIILVSALSGFALSVNVLLLIVFVATAFLDEKMHDFVGFQQALGRKVFVPLRVIGENRLLFYLAAVAASVFYWTPLYFAAIFVFDFAAYLFVDVLLKYFRKPERVTKTQQLLVDLTGCSRTKLDDMRLVYRLLDSMPALLGMKKITAPYVFRYESKETGDEGITGVVLIAESHITIHTYPKKESAKVDVLSCKPFDKNKALRVLSDAFKARSARTKTVRRKD